MLSSRGKKIAVIGGGALGQYLTARLTQAGHKVDLLLRGDYEAVKTNGIHVTSPHGDVHVRAGDVAAHQHPADIGPSDWVICTVKAPALLGESGKRLISPCIGPQTKVLSLLNGIGIDEVMASIVGDPSRVFGGLAYVAVSRSSPGHVEHVFTEKIEIGHMLDDEEQVAEAAQLLSDCQVNPLPTTSLLTSRWEKVAWNFPFAGMGIVAGGVPCGELMAHQGIRNITRGVMQEVYETANRDIKHRFAARQNHGSPVLIEDNFVEKLWTMSEADSLKGYFPSTVIDYLNKSPVEKDFIFAEPLARAQELGLAVPYMTMVNEVVDILTTCNDSKTRESVQKILTDSMPMATATEATISSSASYSSSPKNTQKKKSEGLDSRKNNQKNNKKNKNAFSSGGRRQLSTVSEVGEQVVEQYDSQQTRNFYKCVMGGGGMDIHFGLFRHNTDNVRVAAENTTELMLNTMDWLKPVKPESVVLDLGSGHGGSTHKMVQRFGNTSVCFNIGEEQNEMNLAFAKELKIDHRITCQQGDFNLGLPKDWESKFDHVYSCEVLCHAADKPALLSEIRRVLKPGGVLVFSDIMGADGVPEEILRPFTDRNVTTVMARPSEYHYQLREAGLREVSFTDLSNNLKTFFQLMLDQVNNNYDQFQEEGISPEYLDQWVESLTNRVKVQAEHEAFAWGVFAAVKDTE